jgi:tetratricopeptide (TPR) repeat protein
LGKARLLDGKEAIQLFQLNTAAYPNSANAYDSLADAYEAAGEVKLALETGEKCLKVLAKAGAPDALREQLVKATQERVERLKKQD